MENSYGVGVLNRYAVLLEDDSDPFDAIKRRERERDNRRKQRDPEKENKAKPEPKNKQQQPQQQQQQQQQQPQQSQSQQQPNGAAAAAKPQPQQQRPPKDGQAARPQQGDAKRDRDQPPKGPRPDGRPGANDRPQRERPFGANDRQGPGQGQGQARRDFGERRPPRDLDGGDRERRPGPPRPRGGGGGGGGGGRPQDGRDGRDGRKREFDRRSGSDRTGVKPVDKRDGAGPHNWGSHRDDLEDLDRGAQSEGERADPERPEGAAVEPKDDAKPQEGKEGEAEAGPGGEEPAPKELTLDEWKALKGARQKPNYNLRKAGEGEDLSRWKDMVALTKERAGEGEGDPEGTDDEYDSAEYPQRVGRQKRVIGIEFAFYEPRRGGGGPAGGRGGRGGRGRGGPRPRRDDRGGGGGGGGGGPPQAGDGDRERAHENKQNAPKVDDSRDFPSL